MEICKTDYYLNLIKQIESALHKQVTLNADGFGYNTTNLAFNLTRKATSCYEVVVIVKGQNKTGKYRNLAKACKDIEKLIIADANGKI